MWEPGASSAAEQGAETQPGLLRPPSTSTRSDAHRRHPAHCPHSCGICHLNVWTTSEKKMRPWLRSDRAASTSRGAPLWRTCHPVQPSGHRLRPHLPASLGSPCLVLCPQIAGILLLELEADPRLIRYCQDTRDPILPSVWGELKRGEDPYAPPETGCGCTSALPPPFITDASHVTPRWQLSIPLPYTRYPLLAGYRSYNRGVPPCIRFRQLRRSSGVMILT